MPSRIPDLVGGAIGGATIITVHESVRRLRSDAPRSDVLGKRAIERSMKALGRKPPRDPALYRISIVSGLLSDAALYALVGRSFRRALAVGSFVGLATVLLPRPLGLPADASARTPSTAVMTMAWYTIGALAAWLAASAASQVVDDDLEERDEDD